MIVIICLLLPIMALALCWTVSKILWGFYNYELWIVYLYLAVIGIFVFGGWILGTYANYKERRHQ